MSHVESTTTLDIDQYLRVLGRQWRVIVATVLLGAAIAAGFLLVSTDRVTAMTQVNLSVITTDPFSPQRAASGLLDDATEAAIASSYVVADRAARSLDDGTPAADLHDAVEVTISEDGTIARVYATAATRARAVAHADAVAEAYLEYRNHEADRRRDAIVADLTNRIDALNTDLADVNESLATAKSVSGEAQASSDREQILAELSGLLSGRTSLQSVDTAGGSVLTKAAQSPVEIAPSRAIAVATGLGGGLALGIVLAFARNPFDLRLRSAAEIARATGARVLAHLETPLPRSPLSRGDAARLRIVRERILGGLPVDRRILVIDDADPDGGTAAELVAAIAETGVPARLADIDDQHAPVPDDAVVIVSYTMAAGEATMLAALRTVDACLLVARAGATSRTTTRIVGDELQRAGVAFLGTIVLPRARAIRPNAAPFPRRVAGARLIEARVLTDVV